MTLPAIVSRMQDCSVFHSDAVGRGPAFWLTDERGWIIVSWQIVFRGTPHFGEALTTRTWGTRFHGIGRRLPSMNGCTGSQHVLAMASIAAGDAEQARRILMERRCNQALGR
jgi:hypothetical protein